MAKKFKKFKLAGKITQWLEENGIDYDETSSGEIKIVECPMCGKTKKLYVDPHTGVAQCKSASCDWNKGISPFELVKVTLGVSKGEAYKICFGDSNEQKDIFGEEDDDGFNIGGHKQKESAEPENIELPLMSENLDKDKHKEAWNYLINRGYTDEIISKIGAKIMPFNNRQEGWQELIKQKKSQEEIKKNLMYINRVIFPLYIDGNIKGYIARDFTGKVDASYKALNSYGSFRSHYFWNYDNVKNSEEIVICEGITDALKCGINRAIALLGTFAADKQIELIKKTNAKKIIFCLDVGTDKSKKVLFEQLMVSYPGNIYNVEMPNILVCKKSVINNNILNAIKQIPNIEQYELDKIDDNNLKISYDLYKDIKKKLKFSWFELEIKDLNLMKDFFEYAEYKDAGDYTLEEMEDMIKNAHLFSVGHDIELM